METATAPNEVAILHRLLKPNRDDLPAVAARAILAIDFEPADRTRMRDLSAKARAGTLGADERAEIECYERVGHLLDLLHSKARRSLKRTARAESWMRACHNSFGTEPAGDANTAYCHRPGQR
jgi:hypothetical protein